MSTADPLHSSHELGESQLHRIPRSWTRDLQFSGQLIGQARRASRPERGERGVAVSIYVTLSGRYVTHVERQGLVTQRPSPCNMPERLPLRALGTADVVGADEVELERADSRAAAHVTPEEAYSWLTTDNGGKLGMLGKIAWVDACRHWPPLLDHETEIVD